MTTREKDNSTFLNYLNLRFINPKLEKEYTMTFANARKRSNKILATCFLIFSCTMWVWLMLLNAGAMNERQSFDVSFEKIEELNKTYRITNEMLANTSIYFGKFILTNSTAMSLSSSGNNTDTSASETSEKKIIFADFTDSSLRLAREALFLSNARPCSTGIFLLHSFDFISIFLLKSERSQKLSFIILYWLSNLNFHTMTGVLLVFYHFDTNSLLLTVVFQHFFRILSIFHIKINWTSIAIACFINITYEWSFFLIVHYTIHQTLVYYLTISTLIHIGSVILSYYMELKNKNEYYLLKRINFDREYLMNFLYNMDHGFITLNNKDILFINKSMSKIIDSFSALTSNVQCSYLDVANDVIRVNSLNPDASDQYEEKRKILISQNFLSNVKINSKDKIESILENLVRVNEALPPEILEFFKNKNTNFSIESRTFRIDNLIRVLKICKFNTNIDKNRTNYESNNFVMNYNNISEFNYLGIINFKKKFKNENFIINDPNVEEFLEKSYQINFRLITHDNFINSEDNEYLEIMFSDITDVMQREREKTINDCRSMYLSKIAHEFKNPLTSLVELSTSISEELTKENMKTNISRINNMNDYSFHICNIMNLFLKDFSLITEIKFPCMKCNVFVKCLSCLEGHVCVKCNMCLTCEEKTHTAFDHKKLIFDLSNTVKNISRHEGKNIYITLEFDPSWGIKTQKDYFYSIFYNLIFHSYKNIDTGNIHIKTEKNAEDDIYFEIHDSGLEINADFLKQINSKVFLEKNDSYEEDDYVDRFNKFFNLYVAFSLIRKIGSNLNICTDEEGNKYSFTLKSAVVNVENSNFNSELFSIINVQDPDPDPDHDSHSKHKEIIIDEIIFEDNFIDTNSSKKNSTVIIENPLAFNYEETDCNLNVGDVSTFPSDKEKVFIRSNNNDNLFHTDITISNFVVEHKKVKANNLSSLTVNVFNPKKERKILTPRLSAIPLGINRILIKKKVIVIDDEVLVRNTLTRFLKKIKSTNPAFDLEIYEAENCFVAIDIIYKSFMENSLFDYVFIDEYMPHMKGSTLIKLMKQLYHESIFYKMTFISHTAFDTPEKKKHILDAGADFILSKPVQFAEFKSFMEDVILHNNHYK